MPFATIRSTLLALIGSLGIIVLALAGMQVSDLYKEHSEASQQLQTNILRAQLVRAALALARERDAMFLALATGTTERRETATETDRSFAAYRAAHDEQDWPISGDLEARVTSVFSEQLPRLRESAEGALSLPPGSQARQAAAVRWFEGVSLAVADLREIRLQLLAQGSSVQNLFTLQYLRTLTLILLDEIMKKNALMEFEVVRRSEAMGSLSEAESAPLTSVELVAAVPVLPVEEFLSALDSSRNGLDIGTFDATIYAEAERALRQALLSGNGLEMATRQWRRASSAAILQLDELQAATFRVSQDRVTALRNETLTYMLAWVLVFCISVVISASSVWVVLAGVVGPLERIRITMLDLAKGNLEVPLPKPSRISEIGAMHDALRVFKVNATRRQSLQLELLKLHGRLEETFAHLKTDLEAAAAIQASLLPQQAQMAGVSLSSYFRPSHFLAGDTFDVLHQPDGRIIVFQIDVAGHGAAAALVSIASKYTVAQVILQREQGMSLADLAQEINLEWPSDLPYFTLVLAEIDPKNGQGVLVQAGHPSPILLRSNGDLAVLGNGGLPIGALAKATFDAIPFAFGPDDRLVLVTDGVLELENPAGEPFSEDRLQKLVRGVKGSSTDQLIAKLDAAMRSWRGNDTLDDDVTIVVLEGTRIDEDHRR